MRAWHCKCQSRAGDATTSVRISNAERVAEINQQSIGPNQHACYSLLDSARSRKQHTQANCQIPSLHRLCVHCTVYAMGSWCVWGAGGAQSVNTWSVSHCSTHTLPCQPPQHSQTQLRDDSRSPFDGGVQTIRALGAEDRRVQWLLSLYLVGAACAKWKIRKKDGSCVKDVDWYFPHIFH